LKIMSLRRTLLGACLLAALPAQARTFGEIEFEPCTLAPDYGVSSVEAQCGKLSVPENPAAPDGRKIDLAIAWIPTDNDDAPDPVFMLAGGPGQSALESYPATANAFRDILRKRHVILVDQRGTGQSNPLVCRDEEGKSAVTESLEDDDPRSGARFAENCAKQLAATADPRFYTTTEAIQDLEAVRQALGVAQINLLGISYGTRVAQQYMRRYPAQVRTVILDGVVPNALVLGAEHAKNLEAAVESHFERCRKDAICRERLGDPRQSLDALAAELRATPRTVSYRDALTGEEKTDELNFGHLAGVVRMFTYVPAAAAMLPLTLHEAAQGRSDTLMSQAQLLLTQVSDQIMHGMQLSVMCSEDAAQLQVDPSDSGTILGTDFVEFSLAQCAVWPKGTMPADFHEPVAGDIPVLLLSGEFDPVTPPRYGDAVLYGWKQVSGKGEATSPVLSNGRHLILRGQGHNVIGVGCTPKLTARFIDTTDAANLDAGCLDRLAYAPPFAGFYGWEP
jgi:pimeloyl-ACP methyl ester carboxylesterase